MSPERRTTLVKLALVTETFPPEINGVAMTFGVIARELGRRGHSVTVYRPRRDDLPARWEYGRHPRVPPIVCQMHEGWDALYPAKLARRPPRATRGSHGFDPALPSMRALFVARGPSFVPGSHLPAFDNVDVYPLLAHLLGIPPAPNDGELTRLLPALRPR